MSSRIEKPLNYKVDSWIESSLVDWDGKICSVVYFSGCNFKCPWCQNAGLVKKKEQTTSLNDILTYMERNKNYVDGVVFSGGEPTLEPSLPNILKEIKDRKFLTGLETNGSQPKVLEEIIDAHLLDFIAMDVKAPLNADMYNKLCGVKVDLKKIRKSIKIVKEAEIEKEFRTTVIPCWLTPEDVLEIAKKVQPVKLVLQSFSPQETLDPKFRNVTPYPESQIQMMYDKIRKRVYNNRRDK